jgi:hypothetical protein
MAMRAQRLSLLLTVVLAGCGTFSALRGSYPPQRFMHQQFREAYAINEEDLERLQFFVSQQVIAHDLDATGPQSVILVEAGTPGVAVASGPRWIRVAFQEDGSGVVFLAEPSNRSDSQYTLATEVPGREGYQLVRKTKDRVLRSGTRRFAIVEGAGAYLTVDGDSLEKVIGERRKIEGQRVPDEPDDLEP